MRGKQRYTSNPPARRPPSKVSTDSNKSRRLKKLRANAALNLRQNSELPVAKLPVEILLQIFYEYIFHGAIEIGISRRYDVDDRLDKRNCRWLTIIQICHHWRNIVLSVPVLWSYITDDICYYPHLLEMALSRSAETLLDVEIHWVTEPAHTTTVAMLTRLFKESRRIRRLYLHLPAHKVADVTLSATAPFTCLEDLEISNPRELPPDPPYLAFIMISRPPTHPLVPLVTRILEEDRPPLKIAVFNDIVIPPHLLSYLPSTLTHLILNDSSTPPYSNDGIRVTNLDFLRKLEKLEILHLGPVETHMRNDIVTFGTTKLVLPHLKQLSISGEQSSMLGLLHWITLPSTTRLHIQTLRDSGPHLDFCTTILSMIHQRIDYQQVQCIIDFEEEVKFSICALGDDHRRCPYGLNYRRILSSNRVIHCNHCYISLELSHRTWQHIEYIPSMKVILSNLKALYLLIPHP
ncbi:hypothetical protein QCA50_017480 [Cerrena zonata]|uniref:F-box domain-containing protein n=1 Tax=Cerrena zonata TaxID=2478898 RepID=A0AAW0FQ24_9APHY